MPDLVSETAFGEGRIDLVPRAPWQGGQSHQRESGLLMADSPLQVSRFGSFFDGETGIILQLRHESGNNSRAHDSSA